jgi:predicted aldo/keto reductase-like oxidoreductase
MFNDPGNLRWDIKMDMPRSELPEYCLKCGKCESHCPQAIRIRDELENAGRLIDEVLK